MSKKQEFDMFEYSHLLPCGTIISSLQSYNIQHTEAYMEDIFQYATSGSDMEIRKDVLMETTVYTFS